MPIETYQVERVDDRKVIHYNGYSWPRESGEKLPYAFTEGTFCFVEIGAENFGRACERFAEVHQYQADLDVEQLIEIESFWKTRGRRLHMDAVTQETPCGMYWFEGEVA